MSELNEKIFKEWLPNNNEYENGIMNEKFYTEVWIYVKKIIII